MLWQIPLKVSITRHTAKNTVILPNFLVWKFCEKAQFPYQEIRRNYGIFRRGTFFTLWRIIILQLIYRSSHQRCFVRKDVLRNFTKLTGKHLCQSLFFNKVADLKPATSLKKRLCHRCFSVNFAKFLKTPFLQNTSGRLLLDMQEKH